MKKFLFLFCTMLTVVVLGSAAAYAVYSASPMMADDEQAEATDPYEAALAAIEDGKSYRIFSQVDGVKYYITPSGTLTDQTKKAGTFTFVKKEITNGEKPVGIKVNTFSNPKLDNNQPVLNSGQIYKEGQNRDDWEAQVFFLNAEGKYAIRATNSKGGDEGWPAAAKTFWTVNKGDNGLVAEYSFDQNYIWEIEANVDNRPEVFNEISQYLNSWPGQLQQLFGLVKDASQWATNAQEPNEGPIANITDGNINTFFHSRYSAAEPDEDHYVEATLPEATDHIYIAFIKRQGSDNGLPTQIDVTGGNAAKVTITDGLPANSWYFAEVNLSAPTDVVRFTVPTTKSGGHHAESTHPYICFGEFYVLPDNEILAEVAQYYKYQDYTDLDESATVDDVKALNDKIGAAAKKIELDEAVDKLQAFIDTKGCTAKKGAAEEATSAIQAAKAATYANAEAVEKAIAEVQEIGKTFTESIVSFDGEPVEIQDYFIANPAPVASFDGWEGDVPGDYSDGVREYWNKAGASFHQTISLPAGTYKLTAIALTRTDMVSTIYAGENETNIVTVANTVVNNRGQAATWFAQGNGVNEVTFTLEEAGDIEIGLRADETTGDHWTVYRNFTLELISVTTPDPYEAAMAQIKEGSSYLISTTVNGKEYYMTVKDNKGVLTDDIYTANLHDRISDFSVLQARRLVHGRGLHQPAH